MKPVNSIIKHDPENGTYGDCYRACLASILELEISEVPHFKDPSVKITSKEWLKEKGLCRVSIPFQGNEKLNLEEILNHLHWCTGNNCYYILTAKSKKMHDHSVVCKGNEIVHDPTYSPEHGIIGPIYDHNTFTKYWWIHLLVKI